MDRNRWNMNRAQRMQLKAFICLLGILLLVILLLGRFLLLLIHRDEEEEERPIYRWCRHLRMYGLWKRTKRGS